MVICAIIGCSNWSDQDKVCFFSLPTIVRDKGDQMLAITTEWCCVWLRAISRQDLVGEKLKNTFICEKRFENSMLGQHVVLLKPVCYCYIYVCIGKPAYHMFKNDADWAPFLHHGHDKLGPGRNESHQERDRRAEARKRKKNMMHSLWMKWMFKNWMITACGIKKHTQCILVSWRSNFLMKRSS